MANITVRDSEKKFCFPTQCLTRMEYEGKDMPLNSILDGPNKGQKTLVFSDFDVNGTAYIILSEGDIKKLKEWTFQQAINSL